MVLVLPITQFITKSNCSREADHYSLRISNYIIKSILACLFQVLIHSKGKQYTNRKMVGKAVCKIPDIIKYSETHKFPQAYKRHLAVNFPQLAKNTPCSTSMEDNANLIFMRAYPSMFSEFVSLFES